MAKLCAELTATDKPRKIKIASNESIIITLYNGNKEHATITFNGDIIKTTNKK